MTMTDPNWEEQFRQFLRKTGDDFRRAGDEVRAEAQRLLDAAMDAEKQQRVRDRLTELTNWARKTAQGVAGAVEDAAVKAEAALFRGGSSGDTSESSAAEHAPRTNAAAEAAPSTARAPAKRAKRASGGSRTKKAAKRAAPTEKKAAKRRGSKKKAAKRGSSRTKKAAKPRSAKAKKGNKRKR
jgi:hypothetical protein